MHFGCPNTYVFSKSMEEMVLGREMRAEDDVSIIIVRPNIITRVHKDHLLGWIEGTGSKLKYNFKLFEDYNEVFV